MTENNPVVAPKNMTWSRFLLKLTIWAIGLGIAGALMVATMVFVTYPKLPSMDELRNYQPKLPLQVYSSDGILLGQFGEEHRIFLDSSHTPKMLVNAILAAEDERFYQHGGIDYLGVLRAAINNTVSGHIQSGASTITMQVARNFFLSSHKTFTRKFNEVLLSYKIENSLTKDQILELYINQIYLGQRSYGFAEAARTYFGKPIDKLSIAEYAVLAGLPKAPSAYNPVVNKERSHDRELYVLGRMKNIKSITPEEYEKAITEKITVVRGSLQDSTDSGGYVAEMVRQMLYAKFGEEIYSQGYKVYTTIDSRMQQAAYIALRNGLLKYDATHGYHGVEQQLNLGDAADADEITEQLIMSSFDELTNYGDMQAAVVLDSTPTLVRARVRDGHDIEIKQLDFVKKYLSGNGDKQIKRGSVIRVRKLGNDWTITQMPEVEGAFVALNPNNGALKSLVGGFDYTDNNFNHVTQAMRQPGSSFKPFIYSAAINHGLTPATVIDDSPTCYPGGVNGSEWCPKNSEGEGFAGPITIRQGLSQSRNLITIKILDLISPKYVVNYLSNFGFNKNQFQPYLTLSLGVNEVTPLQMANAYAVFANGGYLVEPYLIQTITNNQGKIIAKTQVEDPHNNLPVIDPRNAFIMNNMLQDVARFGTGAAAYRALNRADLAGKTGTTQEGRDVWFDGYVPDLVAITWVGFDQPKSLGDHAYGANIALPIWIEFMQAALPRVPARQLAMPDGILSEPNTTWKGQTEYTLDPGYTASNVAVGTRDNAGVLTEQDTDDAPTNEANPDTTDGINSIIQDIKN